MKKIFEKVIYKRIFDFIYKHKILREKQFSFIKNKGTRKVLSYRITKRIYENLDKGPFINYVTNLVGGGSVIQNTMPGNGGACWSNVAY